MRYQLLIYQPVLELAPYSVVGETETKREALYSPEGC